MAGKKLVVNLGANISDFNKAMSSVKGTTANATKGITGSFKSLLSPITSVASSIGKIGLATGAFKLVNAGINMITGSFDSAIKRVDTLNQFPKVLQQMGFSAEQAEASTKKLSEGIQGLPTTLGEVVSTTQRLTNVFGDVDKATDTTLALNAAFLASGASSADAARGLEQYSQMLSSGKVDMQSWRSLQETMPYALQKTAEAFGYTGRAAQNDLYKALQDGTITFDQFNDKIIELSGGTGGFAEVALQASKGIGTSWQNIKTAITNGVAGVIQAFDEWLNSNGFGGIAGVLDKIKASVSTAFGYIIKKVPEVLNWFTELYNKVSESTAWTSFKELVSGAMDKITELWNKFMESEALENVKQLMSDLGDKILEIDFEKLTDDIQAFTEKWAPLIAAVGSAIVLFGIWNALQSIYSTVMVLSAAATTGLSAALAFLTSPVALVIAAIAGLVAIGVYLYQNWDEISAKASEIWEKIKSSVVNFIEETKKKALEIWQNIKNKTIEIFTSIKNKATEKWQEIKTSVSNAVEGAKNKVSETWENIKAKTIAVFEGVKSSVREKWEGIKSSISNAVEGAKTKVSNIWENIKSKTTGVFESIKSTATEKWNAVKSAIINPIESAKNKVKGIVDTIKGFFNGMKLSIPKFSMPPLPHFSLSGKFSLKPPSVPKLGVSWYETGGIATSASVVGIGENGDEAILPLSNKKRMKPFASAVASMMDPKGNTGSLAEGDVIITGNSFTIREEADIKKVAQELYKLQKREGKGKGR